MSVFQWQACYSCRDYAEHRRATIAGPLADKARHDGRDVIEVVDEFMLAAHRRHMSGEPLRAGGPTRVIDPAAMRAAVLFATLHHEPTTDDEKGAGR